jgi:hypothetical protein
VERRLAEELFAGGSFGDLLDADVRIDGEILGPGGEEGVGEFRLLYGWGRRW